MATVAVHNLEGKKVEGLELPDSIFAKQGVNTSVIHQAVVMYRANQRQGNASTKERGSVSGGGRKPYRQKGTGQARAGSIRSPLWRGGGVVFGPHPRDFGYTLPKKIRKSALREVIHSKMRSNDVFCVDKLVLSSPKTKEFAKTLTSLKLTGKVLAVVDKKDNNFELASRNLPFLKTMRVEDITAYDMMRFNKILIAKAGFKKLLERLQ